MALHINKENSPVGKGLRSSRRNDDDDNDGDFQTPNKKSRDSYGSSNDFGTNNGSSSSSVNSPAKKRVAPIN